MTDDSGADEGDDADEEVLGMYEQSGDSTVVSDVSDDTAESSDAAATDATEADAAEETDEDTEPRFDAPVVEPGGDDPETVTGTFYVKNAEESAVTLHEVDTTQIITLIENPGFEVHDIVEATVVAQPPMEVSYLVEELDAHYSIPIETSPEPPTSHVQGLAEELDAGESVAIAREGEGEIHILRVEPDDIDRIAEDLHEDEMPYKNAARYDVNRVEIRTHEDGIVSIRYLP